VTLTAAAAAPASAIFAVRLSDGQSIWRKDLNGGTFAALTYANGVVYQNTAGEIIPPITGVTNGAKLRAFDAKTGTELFEYANNVSTTPLTANRTLGGNTIYKDSLYWSFGSNSLPSPLPGPSGDPAYRVIFSLNSCTNASCPDERVLL
jgi:outer membrane protein assembly factor BamB